MEEQIKKIYEKQKNGRIRMIRNVLLIYAALICVVSIFKGNPFPHQETVLFFDVKQPGWVTTIYRRKLPSAGVTTLPARHHAMAAMGAA